MSQLKFIYTCLLFFISASHAKATFTIWADTVAGPTSTTVDVNVKVTDFTDIISVQGTIQWNPAVATYNSMVTYGLPGMTLANFGTTQVGTGKIMFSWNDGTLIGVDEPAGHIIFTIRFNLIGAGGTNTPLTFVNNPTLLEFVDVSFSPIVFVTNPGLINVTGGGNSITTSSISGSPFCAGASVNVPFTASGTYTMPNTFTAQLSDASGSFTSPVAIGTLAGTSSGIIAATIPGGTVAGTGYRIRVVSSNPVVTGSDNGANLTVNTIPAAPGPINGSISICAGSVNNYSIPAVAGATSYTWTLPAGWTGSSTTTTVIATTGASGGTITVTANNSCGSSSQTILIVTVSLAPVAGFSSLPAGQNVTFTDLSLNSPTSWLWDFGDGNSTTLSNPVHTYGTPGTYIVCLTVTSPCGSDSLCANVTVTCGAPTANYSYSGVITAMSFTDLSTNAPTSWVWDFDDGSTSTLQNPTHAYVSIGTYNVCLIVTNACGSDTICSSVNVLSGVNEPDIFIHGNIYPNPATDLITMDGDLVNSKDVQIILTDVWGRKAIEKWVSPDGNHLNQTLDVHSLATGVYFVSLRQNGNEQVMRLVVE